MTTTALSEFLGSGPSSSRPAAPDIPAGVTALWFNTDLGFSSIWSGTGWVDLVAAGSVSVVQSAFNSGAGITGVTLPAPPTPGNLLVGIIGRTVSTNVAAAADYNSWLDANNSGTLTRVVARIAQAGDAAAQTLGAVSYNGIAALWEIANLRVINFGTVVNAAGINLVDLVGTRGTAVQVLGVTWSAGAGTGDTPVISGTATLDQDLTTSGVVDGASFVASLTDLTTRFEVTATYATSRGKRITRLFIS